MGVWDNLTGWVEDMLDTSKGGTTAERKDIYTPEQRKLLDTMVARSQAGMDAGPAPESPQGYVPETGLEGDYLDWARTDAAGYARGELPYKSGDAYVDEFMESYRPVWERARGEAMDLARSEWAGPGYWGSARADAMTELGSEWGERYAMTEADLRLQEDKNRKAAIDKYIGIGTEGLRTGGGMERGIEQERVSSDMNRFLRGEEVDGKSDPIYNQNTQLALALLGFTPWTYAQETEAPGAGYSAAIGAASVWSSIRFKRDVEYSNIEVLPGVYGVFFNYKDGLGLPEGRQFSVLAEDLVKDYPEYVIFDSKGRPTKITKEVIECLSTK